MYQKKPIIFMLLSNNKINLIHLQKKIIKMQNMFLSSNIINISMSNKM